MEVSFSLAFYGEVSFQMFGAYHILQYGVAVLPETKYYKRFREYGMEAERQDAKRHRSGWSSSLSASLAVSHHRAIAYPTPENGLIEHYGQVYRRFSGKNLLALHPYFY